MKSDEEQLQADGGEDTFDQEDDVEEEVAGEENNEEDDPAIIVRRAIVRALKQRVYSDGPPVEITDEDIADLPNMASTQEAATCLDAIDENIQLVEMRADAQRRAERLRYLEQAHRAPRCEHIKFNGEKCGSPAIRGQRCCYFHTEAYADAIALPLIEDQSSLQLAFRRLTQQLLCNQIDPMRARVVLQVLEATALLVAKEASSLPAP